MEEVDLYGLLGVNKSATQADIRKAFRKLALQHHPDKVAEDQRAESEAKFKAISQAYEILYDEEKRRLYDMHGMAAFDRSQGGHGGEGMDPTDIFAQMFGMGGGMRGGPRGPRRPRKGPDEQQEYQVTLEDLYKGKTVKFAANKKIICPHCKGTGGKDKEKASECDRCNGVGVREVFQQVGPGLVQRVAMPCDHCSGTGVYYKEKDRCKKCKAQRVIAETQALEIYIPRGAMNGERIVLEGEADQHPDQTPGDIVFVLVEREHEKFTRAGNDLSASLKVTLAEALTGFSRVVLTHLDGRGIHIDHPQGKVLRPGEVLKVPGEGMPMKRGELKGDLYLMAEIEFPSNCWPGGDEATYETLKKLLPPPAPPIVAEEVDEVDYEESDIDHMGATSGGHGQGAEWEDQDEDGPTTQCAPQ